MKKIYSTPVSEIVELTIGGGQQLCAASPDIYNNTIADDPNQQDRENYYNYEDIKDDEDWEF